jgi:hypothetical protein
MNKLVIILCLLFSASSFYAQTEVTAGVTRGKDFGVVYTLPKTEFILTLKAIKTTYTPGEFSKYADRYLRLNNILQEPEEYWKITSVDIQSIGVPDSKCTYFVKMKDKTVAPLIELTKDGIIKSINVPYDRKKEETKNVAITPPANLQKKKIDPRSFLTEEILMTGSTAKMAELIAREIYNIRESKNALLRGQADNMPKDGEQLKLMLDNLNEQENALTTMFTGTQERHENTYTLPIVPDKELKNEIIFRFSKKLGMVAADNLAGEPVYLSLKNLKSVKIPAEDEKKKELEGVAYKVPGKAEIIITKDKDVLFKEEFPVTQFGIIEYLAPTLFNNKSTVTVVFSATTGGLIKVDRGNSK